MSYCVNCGVELRDSEPSCPLCLTPVINPVKPWSEPQNRPYPQHVDHMLTRVNRRYGVSLTSMLLLIPCFITSICNLLISGRIDWSAYIVGACLLLYVIVLLPLQFAKPNAMLVIALDTLSILGYLALINIVTGARWFFGLAIPIVLTACSFAVITVVLVWSAKLGVLVKAGAMVLHLSGLCMAINISVNHYIGKTMLPDWSLFVAVPCAMLSMILFYTDSHQALKERIRRKLYY